MSEATLTMKEDAASVESELSAISQPATSNSNVDLMKSESKKDSSNKIYAGHSWASTMRVDPTSLANPLDKGYPDAEKVEFTEWVEDAPINKAFGFKTHDPSTWPKYLKEQAVSPNDIRMGWTHNQYYLPKILHANADPQYIGDFDYPSLDIGTSYVCDPAPFVFTSSFDRYYRFQPEDGAAYVGTWLEKLFGKREAIKPRSRSNTPVTIFDTQSRRTLVGKTSMETLSSGAKSEYLLGSKSTSSKSLITSRRNTGSLSVTPQAASIE